VGCALAEPTAAPVTTARPALTTPAGLTGPHAPADWPVAAAMLQFPGTTADGRRVHDLPAPEWRALLQPVVDAGFTALELASTWVRPGDLSPARLAELRGVLDDAGLAVPGLGVVRESVVHPGHGAENLAFSHRTIDAAAELGAGIVCLGLHDALTPRQQQVEWFWTVPGTPLPADPAVRDLAVARYRELAEHAASVGVQISLELYEDTWLGTADEAVRFLDDIDHPAAGLNPDLGNLVRQQRPVESWQYLVATTLPRANYWHVKNYARFEAPDRDLHLTHPTSLELGVVNYRDAVRFAIAHGFDGAFVVEHYGGDGLSVGCTNAAYLRSVLPPSTSRETA
jgi:sugar phosphate isomerase/epimerase